MKKVAKAILIALGIILVIGAVAVLGVNLYVQSAGTHARIEHGLSTGLHSPVKIGSLSFMPWHGLKLSAISRDDPEAFSEGNSLEISDISLHFRLWNLLRHDVVIKELTVDGVKVSWTQNPEGKWQMPGSPAPATPEPPAQTETPAAPPPAEQQPSVAPQEPIPPAPPAAAPPPVTVNHARMRDASFSFYDKNHKPVAEFTGVYVQTPSPTDKLVEGTAAISNVVIQQKFYLEEWRGRFKYTPDELSLSETTCKVGGGTATGALDVKISEQDSPFVVDTQFSGVNLDRLLTDAGVNQLEASGMLSGFVHLQGDSRNSEQAQGNGQIVLANGFITKSNLSESLDQLLRTDKFRGLDLQDAHADFHVGSGTVYLDDLVLKCVVGTFTSQGVVTIQGGGLSLQCRLAISGDIARQIPDFLMENFGTDAASGARYVDFEILGDINHPYSTLSKTLGKNLSLKKGVNILWKKYFGGTRKAEPPPAAAPAPAAIPAPPTQSATPTPTP